MRKCLLAATLLLTSCATSNTISTQLETMHRAGSLVVSTGVPLITEHCTNIAYTCAENGDEQCLKLVACDELRHKFVYSVVAFYNALLVADTALAVNNEAEAWEAITVAVEHLKKLRGILKELGIN